MTHFESLVVGQEIVGKPFTPTPETIREFCNASLDYNPIHLDDNYMKGSFGKTSWRDHYAWHDQFWSADTDADRLGIRA